MLKIIMVFSWRRFEFFEHFALLTQCAAGGLPDTWSLRLISFFTLNFNFNFLPASWSSFKTVHHPLNTLLDIFLSNLTPVLSWRPNWEKINFFYFMKVSLEGDWVYGNFLSIYHHTMFFDYQIVCEIGLCFLKVTKLQKVFLFSSNLKNKNRKKVWLFVATYHFFIQYEYGTKIKIVLEILLPSKKITIKYGSEPVQKLTNLQNDPFSTKDNTVN